MALLTTAQKTAIADQPRYRQVWKIYTPRAAGSTTFDAQTIHDDDGGPTCVIDAGSYTAEGYNQSLASPGRLSNGLYRFMVGNADGAFYTSTSGNWFYNSTGVYQAAAIECRVEHEVYVWDGAAGSWSELTMVNYLGEITSVEYDDDADAAVIEAVAMPTRYLEYQWTFDDGAEEDTGMDVTWP